MAGDEKNRNGRKAIDEMLRDRIIPRLVEGSSEIELTKRSTGSGAVLQLKLKKNQIDAIADNLIDGDGAEVNNALEAMFAQGHSMADIFLELLAPIAVELGSRWTSDLCSFADVTMGMSELHTVLRKNSTRLAMEISSSAPGESILVTPMPGQTHVFGASIVEEFFRAANWDVRSGVNASERDLLSALADEHFTIVGLSVAHNGLLEDCKCLISEIRKVSLNQEVKIMVGGPAFVLDPSQVEEVGADATASNAKQALEMAKFLNDKVG